MTPEPVHGGDERPSGPRSRYETLVKIASGGMGTVFVGRVRGPAGFWRLCALKRPHDYRSEDPAFRRMFVEEARLASRIHHANVASVLDVEETDGQLLLVMDYIEGVSLAELVTSSATAERPLPARAALRIALDACAGLRAAHELTDAGGEPLQIVHRDISPQNILVGVDGTSRITDFGIAKSAQSDSSTTGVLKGKLGYMAPEYLDGRPPDARSDVFALGVVVWEALAHKRLFRGDSELDTIRRVLSAPVPPLSELAPWLGKRLDTVLAQALEKAPDERFQSARAFGEALEAAARKGDLIGTTGEVGDHVRGLFSDMLAGRRAVIRERVSADPPPSVRPRRKQEQGLDDADDGERSATTRPKAPQALAAAAAIQEHGADATGPRRRADAPGAGAQASPDGGLSTGELRVAGVPSRRASSRRGVLIAGLAGLALVGVAIGAGIQRWAATSPAGVEASTEVERAPAAPTLAGAGPAATAPPAPSAEAAATALPFASASARSGAPPAAAALPVKTGAKAAAPASAPIRPNPYR